MDESVSCLLFKMGAFDVFDVWIDCARKKFEIEYTL